MQIVINIDDEDYDDITLTGENTINLGVLLDLREAVRNGKILPRGHGRIGDLDRLYTVFEKNVVSAGVFKELFDHAPTIIDADEVKE